MAPLLADENFPLPVVESLRRIGHDVVTMRDIGKAGESLADQAILLLATADDRAASSGCDCRVLGCGSPEESGLYGPVRAKSARKHDKV